MVERRYLGLFRDLITKRPEFLGSHLKTSLSTFTLAKMLFYLILSLFVYFAVFRSYNLIKNYITTCRFGLPIILLPSSFEDVWWIPLRSLFSWVEHLPFGLGTWYVYTEMGWPTVDGNRTSIRLGENFVLCSPSSNQIVTCYPPAVDLVFRHHKNWLTPKSQSQLLAIYGQNVSSTNGSDWQRHRKVITAAFNEQNMREVWKESVKRATALNLSSEDNRTLGYLRSTFEVLAMHVLAVVGFGQDVALTSVAWPSAVVDGMPRLHTQTHHTNTRLFWSQGAGLAAPRCFPALENIGC
jgi:hypothetical protein